MVLEQTNSGQQQKLTADRSLLMNRVKVHEIRLDSIGDQSKDQHTKGDSIKI